MTAESTMHGLINDKRVQRGFNTLTVTTFLKDYAEGLAQRMADQGSIFHDPCSGCSEVVGVVDDAKEPLDMFQAWMNSEEHKNILMDSRLTKMGAGKVTQGGFDWWAVDFRF